MRTPKPPKPLSIASLRGALQAGVAGTVAVTTLAEAIHMAVLATPALAVSRGLTRVAYAGVRGTAGWVGQGGDRVLRGLGHVVSPAAAAAPPELPLPLGLQAVLNGIAGDRLERMGHPSALRMRLVTPRPARRSGEASSGGEVLFVHGLCMHDGHWRRENDDAGFGQRLRDERGLVPMYLRYNTGLPIAENGRRLAMLLARRERALRREPGPLNVVAHSLGGLVVRSAVAWAVSQGLAWPHRLRHAVFLGTPHEGAPLERAGRVLESVLAGSRFSAPWAAVGRLRSVAIRQLGDSAVEDWPMSLPQARLHAIAACQHRWGPRSVHEHWGDGLVPVGSALASSLPEAVLPLMGRHVVDRLGHLELIRDPRVADHLTRILT